MVAVSNWNFQIQSSAANRGNCRARPGTIHHLCGLSVLTEQNLTFDTARIRFLKQQLVLFFGGFETPIVGGWFNSSSILIEIFLQNDEALKVFVKEGAKAQTKRISLIWLHAQIPCASWYMVILHSTEVVVVHAIGW